MIDLQKKVSTREDNIPFFVDRKMSNEDEMFIHGKCFKVHENELTPRMVPCVWDKTGRFVGSRGRSKYDLMQTEEI